MRLMSVFVACACIVGWAPPRSDCSVTSVGFTPLSDSGTSPYPGVPLGLYPNGSNEIPPAHLAAGMAQAALVVPRRPNGKPSTSGQFVLLSIGMSNTTNEFQTFMALNPSSNPKLVIVDGAQGGQTAAQWANPSCPCWSVLTARLAAAGVTDAQVSAVWVKLTNAYQTGEWPTATLALQQHIDTVVRALATRFPNLAVAYLSSRIYAGYALTAASPEPYAYQSAFAVRGVIEAQLNGQLPFSGPSRVSPWLAWGPYMWADGLTPRSDGLTWNCTDFRADDLMHPSAFGKAKVADMLLNFFTTHPTTTWFVGAP